MKSRNREVNIFNMSILDVLSGALGAFCFMMLALFPYYKPAHLSAEDKQSYQNAQQTQQKLQQLEAEMKQARARPDPQLMQKVQSALGQARQQIGQVQQQLDRTRAAMEQAQQSAAQAQQSAAQAESAANHANSQLAMKHNLVVQEWWTGATPGVDMYIHNPGTGTNGKTAPPFDPSKSQSNFFQGTQILTGPGSHTWVIGNTLPGEFKVYYRLSQPQQTPLQVTVVGRYAFESSSETFPAMTLSAARPYAQVGSIVIDQKGQAKFVAAGGSPSSPLGPGPVGLPSSPPAAAPPAGQKQ